MTSLRSFCIACALSVALLSVCAMARGEGPSGAGVAIKDVDGALEITVDGKAFATYRYTGKTDDPKWDRPYFWPVLAGDGTGVTSDQWRLSQTKKTDHPWHRSLYVGWGDVNGIDHWRLSANQERHLSFEKMEGDTFVEKLAWDGKGADASVPVLTETRTVRVIVYPDGARGIDLQSALTAASGDAVFKCLPLNVQGVEAGLCAVRMAEGISTDKGHEIVTAAGTTGEKGAREVPSAWCDYSGMIGGKKYGVTMVGAIGNIGGERPWHVRDLGLFANIGPLNWTLKKGETLVFRDLVIVHEGDAVGADVKGKAEGWRASLNK